MRINIFAILFYFHLVVNVSARGPAGAYERVWFWYAYQISLTAFGVDGNQIVKNCRGTGVNGTCKFIEFIEHGTPGVKTDFEVSNPKNIISDSLENLKSLGAYLEEVAEDIGFGRYGSDEADVADSAALPVYLAENAVSSMKNVIKIGEKVEAEEMKTFILLFVSAILFLIPGLEQAVGTGPGFMVFYNTIPAVTRACG